MLPHFFKKSSYGVDISDESVKFIELVKAGREIKPGRYGWRAIPPGVIESGKIKDHKKMEEILSALQENEGIRSARVSLPEEQMYLFSLHLEKSGLKNVREGIERSFKEHVPMRPEEAIFDYDVISENPRSMHVQVATIPKNVIGDYSLAFEYSNMDVRSCELEAQSIARAVIKKGDKGTHMIVDFGKKSTGIFIVFRGIVRLTYTLDFGGEVLTDMIQRKFNVPFEEAEKIKHEQGMERTDVNAGIFSMLLDGVSFLADGIAKLYIYWQTHADEEGRKKPSIENVILCGGDSNLTGLADYLSARMKIPVEMANVWTNLGHAEDYIPEMNFKQTLAYATAIGLALGDYEG